MPTVHYGGIGDKPIRFYGVSKELIDKQFIKVDQEQRENLIGLLVNPANSIIL